MKIKITETDAQTILSLLEYHKQNYNCSEADRVIKSISGQIEEKQNRKKRSF